jgi:hypothetical protein
MRRHQLRYWNGSEWGEHVADSGQAGIDPLTSDQVNAPPEHHEVHPLPPPTLGAATVPPPPVVAAAAAPAALSTANTPPKQRVATWMIVAAILALAGIAVGAVFVVRGGDKTTTGNAAELFLEPAKAAGSDPFTPSVDTNTAPPPVRIIPMAQPTGSSTTLPATTLPTTLPTTTGAPTTVPGSTTTVSTVPAPTTTVARTTTVAPTTTVAGTTGVRSVNAVAPGLYGGTRNNQACNPEQMIQYLTNTPAKAAAWAGAQGIQPSDIPTFIRSLTPVVLRADTRVTNFGYRNGVANPKPAVLQAGTAVLVDQYGIPRARCSCGNPLAPARPLPAGYTTRGTPWPGYNPTSVIVVVNVTNVVVKEFVMVDLTGGYFSRTPAKSAPSGTISDGNVYVDSLCDMMPNAPECLPPTTTTTLPTTTTQPEPTLGTGDVQFTLRWNSKADLDIAVLDPNNEEINFDRPRSSSGGQLDVDSNSECATAVTNPVENVFWPVGKSLDGLYKVQVRYYDECGDAVGPQSFTLTARIGGVEVALQPAASALLAGTGSLNAPGDSKTYEIKKTPGPPIAVDTTVATTTPPASTGPASTTPSSRVPVGSEAPIGTTSATTEPGQAVSLEQHCRDLYPPVIGAANMNYTLCMHDPTVT